MKTKTPLAWLQEGEWNCEAQSFYQPGRDLGLARGVASGDVTVCGCKPTVPVLHPRGEQLKSESLHQDKGDDFLKNKI